MSTGNKCEFPGCIDYAHDYHWFFKKHHCTAHSPHTAIWPGKKFAHAINKETDIKKQKKMMARKGFGKRYF